MQPTLFPLPGIPDRPKRRVLWRTEMRRLMWVVDDQRARDLQRQAEATGHLRSMIADLRDRVTDLERGEASPALRQAPTRRAELVRFAR